MGQPMTEQILQQDIEAHKAAVSVLGIWAMRELPVLYNWIKISLIPLIVKIYPYCIEHGGVFTIIKSFFVGKQQIQNNEKTIN